jgi:hypothetical protein
VAAAVAVVVVVKAQGFQAVLAHGLSSPFLNDPNYDPKDFSAGNVLQSLLTWLAVFPLAPK